MTTVPWHARARQKFYTISAEAAGLRAAQSECYGRLAQLRRDQIDVQRDRARLADAVAWNDPLPNRDGERNRAVDRLADYAAEIERLQAVEDEARKNLERITGRMDKLSPLVDRCARLLVRLHLLNREEVSL
jgi:chromosome segregation ATPase